MDSKYPGWIASLLRPQVMQTAFYASQIMQAFNANTAIPVKHSSYINSVDVKYQNNRGIGQLIH